MEGGGRNLSNISNSYAMGSVSGSSQTGGLVGLNWPSTTGSIINCYSTGASNGGGLIGENVDGVITASFWDWQASGSSWSDGGTSKTTAEMQTQSTFTDAGWDFINEIINGTEDIWYLTIGQYPRFAWEGVPPQVVSWQTGAPHGGIVDTWCAADNGYIEPRSYGIEKLRVCFDTDMDTSPLDIGQAVIIEGTIGGTQSVSGQIVWESSACMVIELDSALPDEDAYIITLTGAIKSAAEVGLENVSMCLTALKGDANGDRSVTAGDLLAIRANNNQPVNSGTARYDINCDGFLTAGDLLARVFILTQNIAPAHKRTTVI
jgi:hypothetical protein